MPPKPPPSRTSPTSGRPSQATCAAIGIATPQALVRQDPYALYERVNAATGQRHDPCLCDCFIAAVRFMEGGPPTPWWRYTAERKRHFADHAG